MPTLREVLDRFMTAEHARHGESITEASQRDIRREIAIFAYDWLNCPASHITPEAAEALVAEIKEGKYKHPLFKMDDVPRALICEDLRFGTVRIQGRQQTQGRIRLVESYLQGYTSKCQ